MQICIITSAKSALKAALTRYSTNIYNPEHRSEININKKDEFKKMPTINIYNLHDIR